MKKIAVLLGLTLGLMALVTVPASAAGQPQWDMTGTYTIRYVLGSGQYDHTDTFTVADSSMVDPEAFSGTGYYVPDNSYMESVAGTLTGSALDFVVTYTGTGAGYTVHAVGTVDSEGVMSGTATSGSGQDFTWSATGKARPFGYTEACASGEIFVPSTGGIVTLPTVPGHKYSINASGTYYAGGAGVYDIHADAEYSQDRAQFAAGDPWTKLVNVLPSDVNLLDLMIDGQGIDWGASYSPTHTYTVKKVAGTSTLSFAFNVYDSYPSNNVGGLCVSLTDLGNIGTFSGFFAPIDNNMVNSAKAGQAIPVKWRLLDYNGVPISDPSSFVSLGSMSAGTCGGLLVDAIETYAGSSGLQYLGDGYWQFNWKTPKSYAGQCRTMVLTLSDGSTHTASFAFK